jgi:hypothetical protein
MNIRVEDFMDQEAAMSTILRITGGNFRAIHRLLMQIERILQINDLQTVTKENADRRSKVVFRSESTCGASIQ